MPPRLPPIRLGRAPGPCLPGCWLVQAETDRVRPNRRSHVPSAIDAVGRIRGESNQYGPPGRRRTPSPGAGKSEKSQWDPKTTSTWCLSWSGIISAFECAGEALLASAPQDPKLLFPFVVQQIVGHKNHNLRFGSVVEMWDHDVGWLKERIPRVQHLCRLTLQLEQHGALHYSPHHRTGMQMPRRLLAGAEFDALDLHPLDIFAGDEIGAEELSSLDAHRLSSILDGPSSPGIGKRKMTLVPRPTSLSILTWPRWSPMAAFTMERPSPVPSPRTRAGSPLKKRSNTRSRSGLGIPVPVSDTVIWTASSVARASICLLYTSDAADDLLCVDLGGRRII